MTSYANLQTREYCFYSLASLVLRARKHTWDGDGTSILRLSLDCPLTGECRPFHFLEHSPLLVSVLTLAARCVEKGDDKVQALEAEDVSRSTAARSTTIIE